MLMIWFPGNWFPGQFVSSASGYPLKQKVIEIRVLIENSDKIVDYSIWFDKTEYFYKFLRFAYFLL